MRPRSTNQEDYLLRLIQEAAAALRLLKHRLAGTASTPEAVREQAGIAIRALLGARAQLLERIDAVSAAHLIGHPEHVELWAALLDVEADAAQRCGDLPSAEQLRARAQSLRDAALGM